MTPAYRGPGRIGLSPACPGGRRVRLQTGGGSGDVARIGEEVAQRRPHAGVGGASELDGLQVGEVEAEALARLEEGAGDVAGGVIGIDGQVDVLVGREEATARRPDLAGLGR